VRRSVLNFGLAGDVREGVLVLDVTDLTRAIRDAILTSSRASCPRPLEIQDPDRGRQLDHHNVIASRFTPALGAAVPLELLVAPTSISRPEKCGITDLIAPPRVA